MASPDRPRRPTFAYLCASLHTGAGPEVWKGIQETAEALDVHVVAFPGGRLGGRDDFESLRNRVFSFPQAPAFDGVLSWASSLSGVRGASELAVLHRRFDGLPLVTLADPLPGHPCVRFDVESGMGALVDHLVEVHGYRDIAFVRGPEAHQSAQARYAAFRDSLARHGLNCRDELVTSPRAWDQGREALVELLDRRGKLPGRDFTALVAASDMLAFSILRDLQSRGYRIPSDAAVVGFNDSAESRIATPTLTTVLLPFRLQATEGLRLLYDLWKGAEVVPDRVLTTGLVLRQSCSCRSREMDRAALASPAIPFTDLGFTVSEVQAWIEPLQEALAEPLTVHRDRRFLDRLERVLERVTATRFPASLWQTVLSELRRDLGTLDSGLEDLFGQARILVGEAAVREFSFHQWQRDQKAEQVRQLARSLQGALDPARLSDILTRRLPDLGFRGGWLVRHGAEAPDRAVLMGSFTDRGRLDLPAGGLDFPLASLLPPGTLPDRRRTLVVEPLYYREHSLGYLVLEASGGPEDVYEELRSAVSAAFQTALLLDSQSRNRPARIFDPLAVLAEAAVDLPPGFDRLPYCVGDPDALAAAGTGSPDPVRVRIDGPGLLFEFSGGRVLLCPFPTLSGDTATQEGDRLVVLADGPSPVSVAALEEATALGALVVDPRTLPFEAYATLRPSLCVADWGTGGGPTHRILTLLASDPGWKTVPFLAFPPGHRPPAIEGRDLLSLMPPARPREGGVRVLLVGTSAPAEVPGLVFTSVPSGIHAIPLVQQETFDLVVVASGGPGFRGLDLVEYLSSDPERSGLRVLVLAGPEMAADDWSRLESHPRAWVQADGIWDGRELSAFLGPLARRTSESSPRVKKALAWLVEHHAQDVARWRLADYLSISEDHLTRDFRKELGLTPWDFLTKYRILLAKRALESTDRRLADLARDVGYHDQSYFCRVFRKETGTTPQKYREAAQGAGG